MDIYITTVQLHAQEHAAELLHTAKYLPRSSQGMYTKSLREADRRCLPQLCRQRIAVEQSEEQQVFKGHTMRGKTSTKAMKLINTSNWGAEFFSRSSAFKTEAPKQPRMDGMQC